MSKQYRIDELKKVLPRIYSKQLISKKEFVLKCTNTTAFIKFSLN